MNVKIVPRTSGAPANKLADAELYFESGPLTGLKLVGFSVWEGRGDRGRHVSFPARPSSVNGERRHYMLLRTANDAATAEPLRNRILQEYATHEESLASPAS